MLIFTDCVGTQSCCTLSPLEVAHCIMFHFICSCYDIIYLLFLFLSLCCYIVVDSFDIIAGFMVLSFLLLIVGSVYDLGLKVSCLYVFFLRRQNFNYVELLEH